MAAKVPEITLTFWIIKIAATTLGETGGDALSMTLHLGYLLSTAVFAVLFVAAVAAQIRASRFSPPLYWSVIIATTTAGTTLADFADRSLGIGYIGGSAGLAVLVAVTLVAWWVSEKTISVNSITTRRAEAFYWATILFSNTLGTALGDFLADDGGMGYQGGALVFGAALALLALAYYATNISHTILFWSAFILTRPLGATLGDTLTKPIREGGLHLNRIAASLVIAGLIAACVAIMPQRAGQGPPAQPTA